MKTITNEKSFVQKTLKEKQVSSKPSDTIRLLAKYYFSEGFGTQVVINKVDKFMSENLVGYKSAKWEKKIEDIVSTISKRKDFTLAEVDQIGVTINELIDIQSLDNIDLEKLAFVLLVHAKVGNAIKNKEVDGNWVNSDPKDIATDAKISRNEIQQGKMRYELKCKGLIDAPRGNSVKINYIDDKSEVAIVITNFEDYIDKYLMWKGVIKSIRCAGEGCMEHVQVRSNRQKYCSECNRIRKNERQKMRDQAKIK